jgi:hypothetical protein
MLYPFTVPLVLGRGAFPSSAPHWLPFYFITSPFRCDCPDSSFIKNLGDSASYGGQSRERVYIHGIRQIRHIIVHMHRCGGNHARLSATSLMLSQKPFRAIVHPTIPQRKTRSAVSPAIMELSVNVALRARSGAVDTDEAWENARRSNCECSAAPCATCSNKIVGIEASFGPDDFIGAGILVHGAGLRINANPIISEICPIKPLTAARDAGISMGCFTTGRTRQVLHRLWT